MTDHDLELLIARFEAAPQAEHVAIIEAHPVSTLSQLAVLSEAVECEAEMDALVVTNPTLAAEWADCVAVYRDMTSWGARCDAVANAPEAERAGLIAALSSRERALFIDCVLWERENAGNERAAGDAYYAMVATP
jgi:hypothetical protein